MRQEIPRPGAFTPSPKSPIRHPDKEKISVRINGWKAIYSPVKGIAHKLAAQKGLFSTRYINTFTWI